MYYVYSAWSVSYIKDQVTAWKPFSLHLNIFLYTFKIRSVFERENDTQKTAERHNVKFRTDICDVKAMCQFWKFVSNT